MSWIDYKTYRHPELLEQLLTNGQMDYEPLKGHDIKQVSDNIVKYYRHIPWPSSVDWHMQPLIYGRKINDAYAAYWPRTVSHAKNMPGLVSLSVNFVDARSIIPDHRDDMPMLVDVDHWRREPGYITVVGIDIPGSTIQDAGFHVNQEKKHIRTGDVVTFDGSHVHGGWNNTDRMRVTFYVSINKDYYAIV